MKVAIITPWLVKCGIFTYSRDLIESLAQEDIEVYVCRLPRFGQKTSELLQLVVDQIPVDKIDLIHVQHEYGLYQSLERIFYPALTNLDKPIVTTMHATGNWNIDPYADHYSNKVIVHNEACAQWYGHPCNIIPHGCKQTQTTPKDEAKQSYGVDPRAPIVGYCGFIARGKGLEILIEAMQKIPEAGLLIGGGWHTGIDTTEYIENMRDLSFKVLPKRVQWLGYVPDEHLPTAYGAMDIIVYPSRGATESGALLMALGHGKAVIASRLAPFKEKEKQKALQTFNDIPDLIRKIKRLLRKPEEREQLEQGAKEYCQRNSWANIAKLHKAQYEMVIENYAKEKNQEKTS